MDYVGSRVTGIKEHTSACAVWAIPDYSENIGWGVCKKHVYILVDNEEIEVR